MLLIIEHVLTCFNRQKKFYIMSINGFDKAVFHRSFDGLIEGQKVVEPDTESLVRALEKISTVDSFDEDRSIG